MSASHQIVATLAPYAADDAHSRGRKVFEPAPAHRSQFMRDRDRIIHSAAFRRLEYKTQVFINHEGDLFRTRLTHTLEVAQIARTIARALHLNEDLVEAIALAHDLGHTPFGHAGQDALNDCMKPYGGFEHNIQSLRVIDKLETKYADFAGLNLTFETREGVLKHCTRKKAAELGDVGERFLDGSQPSLEAQLANLADEIAYNNHDVEDGLRSGLITFEQLREVPLFARFYDEVTAERNDLLPKQIRFEVVRSMINHSVADMILTSRDRIAKSGVQSLADVRTQAEPLIGASSDVRKQNTEIKRFLHRNLYQHHRVHSITVKARTVVGRLFDAFLADPLLMPDRFASREASHRKTPDSVLARRVADYIAGMTDRYALDEYQRLFDARRLS